ncbi:hypothetical protein ACIA8C_34025 [Nocardia sp. NPDC051321]|uniref:hypothetical protein n=1 Tax=Nocardia sp. NPDC051321 TaxID=3364323 RepID=UPI00379277C2
MTARTHRAQESRSEQDTASFGSSRSALATAGVVLINSVAATATASLGIISALVLVL